MADNATTTSNYFTSDAFVADVAALDDTLVSLGLAPISDAERTDRTALSEKLQNGVAVFHERFGESFEALERLGINVDLSDGFDTQDGEQLSEFLEQAKGMLLVPFLSNKLPEELNTAQEIDTAQEFVSSLQRLYENGAFTAPEPTPQQAAPTTETQDPSEQPVSSDTSTPEGTDLDNSGETIVAGEDTTATQETTIESNQQHITANTLIIRGGLTQLNTVLKAQGDTTHALSGFELAEAPENFTDPLSEQEKASLTSAIRLLKEQTGLQPTDGTQTITGSYTPDIGEELKARVMADPELRAGFVDEGTARNLVEDEGISIEQARIKSAELQISGLIDAVNTLHENGIYAPTEDALKAEAAQIATLRVETVLTGVKDAIISQGEKNSLAHIFASATNQSVEDVALNFARFNPLDDAADTTFNADSQAALASGLGAIKHQAGITPADGDYNEEIRRELLNGIMNNEQLWKSLAEPALGGNPTKEDATELVDNILTQIDILVEVGEYDPTAGAEVKSVPKLSLGEDSALRGIIDNVMSVLPPEIVHIMNMIMKSLLGFGLDDLLGEDVLPESEHLDSTLPANEQLAKLYDGAVEDFDGTPEELNAMLIERVDDLTSIPFLGNALERQGIRDAVGQALKLAEEARADENPLTNPGTAFSESVLESLEGLKSNRNSIRGEEVPFNAHHFGFVDPTAIAPDVNNFKAETNIDLVDAYKNNFAHYNQSNGQNPAAVPLVIKHPSEEGTLIVAGVENGTDLFVMHEIKASELEQPLPDDHAVSQFLKNNFTLPASTTQDLSDYIERRLEATNTDVPQASAGKTYGDILNDQTKEELPAFRGEVKILADQVNNPAVIQKLDPAYQVALVHLDGRSPEKGFVDNQPVFTGPGLTDAQRQTLGLEEGQFIVSVGTESKSAWNVFGNKFEIDHYVVDPINNPDHAGLTPENYLGEMGYTNRIDAWIMEPQSDGGFMPQRSQIRQDGSPDLNTIPASHTVQQEDTQTPAPTGGDQNAHVEVFNQHAAGVSDAAPTTEAESNNDAATPEAEDTENDQTNRLGPEGSFSSPDTTLFAFDGAVNHIPSIVAEMRANALDVGAANDDRAPTTPAPQEPELERLAASI